MGQGNDSVGCSPLWKEIAEVENKCFPIKVCKFSAQCLNREVSTQQMLAMIN